MGKFGCLSEAAVLRIEHFEGGFLDCGNDARGNGTAAAGERLRLRDRTLDHLRLLDHIAVLFFVSIRDADQYAFEAGAAVTVGGRKVRATVERLALGSEKSGERPAALSADRADGGLV